MLIRIEELCYKHLFTFTLSGLFNYCEMQPFQPGTGSVFTSAKKTGVLQRHRDLSSVNGLRTNYYL